MYYIKCVLSRIISTLQENAEIKHSKSYEENGQEKQLILFKENFGYRSSKKKLKIAFEIAS